MHKKRSEYQRAVERWWLWGVVVNLVNHVVTNKCSHLTEQVSGAAGEACKAEDATLTCTA